MEENWVKAYTEKRIFYRKVKAVENQIKRNIEKTVQSLLNFNVCCLLKKIWPRKEETEKILNKFRTVASPVSFSMCPVNK